MRIAATPWIATRFYAHDCRSALVFLLLAGFTDAADGYIARRFDQITQAGAYLDPIADKLLLTTVFVGLGWLHIVPVWLVWLVVGRDLLIVLMVFAGMVFRGQRSFPPSIWGKMSTAIQIFVALVGVSACAAGFKLPGFLIWLAAAITAWSGIHYVMRAITILRTTARA